MNVRTAVLLLLASCCNDAAAQIFDINPDISDPQDWGRLRQGEVLIENARTSESGGAVRVQILMHGDAETIWTYLASCERVFQYVQGMRACELVETHNDGLVDVSIVDQAVKKSWMTPLMEYTLRVRRERWGKVDFERVDGDLESLEGGWRLQQTDEGLLVTHEIRVKPSFPVPRWLVRRSMRRDIPEMMACLRGLTGASGGFDRQADIDLCPRSHRDPEN